MESAMLEGAELPALPCEVRYGEERKDQSESCLNGGKAVEQPEKLEGCEISRGSRIDASGGQKEEVTSVIPAPSVKRGRAWESSSRLPAGDSVRPSNVRQSSPHRHRPESSGPPRSSAASPLFRASPASSYRYGWNPATQLEPPSLPAISWREASSGHPLRFLRRIRAGRVQVMELHGSHAAGLLRPTLLDVADRLGRLPNG